MAVYIIGEAGINHDGSIGIAKQMIDVARAAGCDAVKFQHYHLHEVQELEDKPAWAAIQKALLTPKQLADLQDYCKGVEILKHLSNESAVSITKIDFLCSAFGIQSAQDLINLQVPILKIPSGKLTDLELLRFVRNEFKGFIISTGLCTKEEIELALLEMKQGTELKNIALLHCVSAYPCPVDQINLRAMKELKGLADRVGISDHTTGNIIPVAAAALGAEIIEKHFTLSRNREGPDHSFSLEPVELVATVMAIRDVEKAMGDGVKKVEGCEKENLYRKR